MSGISTCVEDDDVFGGFAPLFPGAGGIVEHLGRQLVYESSGQWAMAQFCNECEAALPSQDAPAYFHMTV